MSKSLDLYPPVYENSIATGDFIVVQTIIQCQIFVVIFHLASLVEESCITKILRNHHELTFYQQISLLSFANSYMTETGVSDFPKMMVTVTKNTLQNIRPRGINQRDCKRFDNRRYRNYLQKDISNYYLEFNDSGISGFFNLC